MITTNATPDNRISEREERNRQLARKAAAEGVVLLENNGVLPLAPQAVALFGAGAEFTIKGGTGSGEVNVRKEVSVREGLEQAGFQITTEDWLCRYRTSWQQGKAAFVEAARKKVKLNRRALEALMAEEYRYPEGDAITEKDAEGTDICIYVLSRQSGEGYDRRDEAGSFRLTDAEIRNIRFCAEHFASFVLVINTGAPVDLSPLDEIPEIDAVLYMGQIGMEGGNALADVLTGKETPSGKLAVTWPMCYADVPFGEEYSAPDPDHAVYKEGIFVGYRYYDSFHVRPRYAFGYGLSYTEFALQTKRVELQDKMIVCEVSVSNRGGCAGKETVQIYASGPQEGLPKESKRLVTFAKTDTLPPGEESILRLSFPASAISVYDEEHAETVLEAGNYVIQTGNSSCNLQPAAVLELTERIVLSKHKNLCRPEKKITELKPECGNCKQEADQKTDRPGRVPAQVTEDADLPKLMLQASLFQTKTIDYERREQELSEAVEKHLAALSTSDMAVLCAGTGIFGENKGFSVPGAAGHTTSRFLHRGIPNLELCDGPAGLRIQKRSTRTKSGTIKPVDAPISIYEYLPAIIRRFLLGNPEKEEVLYQFVTGFPAAAMIAQTWNTELATSIGRAVSEEMSEYGARIWLAPALNIVRNPLCGRNYEYFSEDPLVSGKMTAAITRGVQDTPGNFVTVKHFAANNQEEDRYTASSDMDERTLREIYLKGFEIAVKEGKPTCVMSAYNRINGTYCSNSKELCTDILRNEWGFDGIVMTDWFAVSKGRAEEGKAIEAGVDLIMPGGKGTIRALKNYAKTPSAKEALRRACGRVLEIILSGVKQEEEPS